MGWKPYDKAAADKRRGSAASRGYDHRWKKARNAFIKANPLCKTCKSEGYTTLANVVDHIIPHKGDMVLFWDQSNWQSLCKTHHNKKTAGEDGGFGNARK